MEKLRFFDLVFDQAGFHSLVLYSIVEYSTDSDEDLGIKIEEIRARFSVEKQDDGAGLPYQHILFSEDELEDIRDAINKVLIQPS
jgi:hypothetical protein